MDFLRGELRETPRYGRDHAVADYLVLNPGEDKSDVRATLDQRLYALDRIFNESVEGGDFRP